MTGIVTTKLAQYRSAPYITLEHDLCFVIEADYTLVRHRQKIKRNQIEVDEHGWMQNIDRHAVLHGEDLELLSLAMDGEALPESAFRYENQQLTLFDVPAEFELYSEVRLRPEQNTQLSGLYRSNGIYCTQCEAEGFRRISFAFDRPDVLSTFRVRIESQRDWVQLSNGNLEAQGELGEDRHFSEWFDPHPKPCYLFALVVGDLEHVSQRYVSSRKDKVDLRIYTAAPFIGQTEWAMKSLVESMAWDEKRFNLHYDLKRFNIVSISDFNMGAMENKSLNIFNDACLLADTETSTDQDFHRIRAIIGHEYFHNWTGNRVTCRDWFQLSLKEGLTVFRDQEFSADLGERSIERVRDIQLLRAQQFTEDKGPMRHPVQPQEYAAIDNFYTSTVYEKGAEIIRMYHTILGEKRFQEGMRIYFERHDGQAVCIEDFAAAMSAAAEGEFDFTGDFFKWYTTAGTPKVSFSSSYNSHERCFILSAAQDVHAVSPPRPLVIPIRFSLLQANGRHYMLGAGKTVDTLILDESRKTWKFKHDDPNLVPVLMQNFSAPIYYDYDYDNEALALIVNHAEDGFARFEAMQMAYRRLFEQALHEPAKLKDYSRHVVELMETVLHHKKYSEAEKALLLALPGLETLMNFLPPPLDMDAITLMYERVRQIIALRLRRALLDFIQQIPETSSPKYSTKDAGIRALQGVIMHYLAVFEDETIREMLHHWYEKADCMTVRMNALQALNERHDARRESALADFYRRFQNYPLVVNKWFALQAKEHQPGALARLEALAEHPDFTVSNPNRFRSLLGAFGQNPHLFHAKDGSGYAFFARQMRRVIGLNPQLAARLLNAYAAVAQLDAERQQKASALLQELQALEGLSTDVLETLERLLDGLQSR